MDIQNITFRKQDFLYWHFTKILLVTFQVLNILISETHTSIATDSINSMQALNAHSGGLTHIIIIIITIFNSHTNMQ